MLRKIYRLLRSIPDRLWHGRRHRAAQSYLRRVRRPRRILVVCHGNVCRSPYLQGQLQRRLPDVEIDSAGFFGADRPVPELSLHLSAERGLDMSQFRSRPVTHAFAAGADLAIVMDAGQARHLEEVFGVPRERILIAGDLDPVGGQRRTIEDPWQGTSETFVAVFDRLDRCAEVVASLLRPHA